MRSYAFVFIYLITLTGCLSPTRQHDENGVFPVLPGNWRFTFPVDQFEIPFNATITYDASGRPILTLVNGSERIECLARIHPGRDSATFTIPVFSTTLTCKIESPDFLSGVWNNTHKTDYKIPFIAEHNKAYRFTTTSQPLNQKKRYKVVFSPQSAGQYDAILLLESDSSNQVFGTFLTETGDYRFLQGNVFQNTLWMSTFDGSHAYLFKATIKDDSLVNGLFLSGKHYQTDWNAHADSIFELKKPETLTNLKPGYRYFDFKLPNLQGDTLTWVDLGLDDKVVIVDIMGSWCPNCLDANKALSELTAEYDTSQIIVLPIAFELTDNLEEAKIRLTKMRKHLPYLPEAILYGGYANKSRAAEVFPMLNHIMSFPTLLFIDRQRNIRRIYTGFYGPGTGEYYNKFMLETETLLRELVAEQAINPIQ